MSDQVIPPGFDVGMFIACLLLKNCPPTMSKWAAMTGALESLTISTGPLSPAFSPATTAYTSFVVGSLDGSESVTVTAKAAKPDAIDC